MLDFGYFVYLVSIVFFRLTSKIPHSLFFHKKSFHPFFERLWKIQIQQSSTRNNFQFYYQRKNVEELEIIVAAMIIELYYFIVARVNRTINVVMKKFYRFSLFQGCEESVFTHVYL